MGKLFLDALSRLQKQSDKKCIIVGEGKIGKILNDFWALYEDYFHAEAFLVDDGFRKQKSYRNLPVYEMTEFLQKENMDDYIFLNTVTSKDSGSFKEELVRKGIKNVLDFNDADMAIEMATEYWQKYFYLCG